MQERMVEDNVAQVPEIPEILENVLLYMLDDARKKLASGEELVPFTALAVGKTLFFETHPAETPDECFNLARHTVSHAAGAAAYGFCYDGYIDTNEGQKDAIIAEGGVPGADTGFALCCLYEVEGAMSENDESFSADVQVQEEKEDGQISDDAPALSYTFADEVLYVGKAPNFMIALIPPGAQDENEGENESESECAEEGRPSFDAPLEMPDMQEMAGMSDMPDMAHA